MADFYPHARARMLKVWATLECPICGAEMESLDDDYETDDELGHLHLDTYICDYCNILLTYVSPAKYHQYHEVPDNEKRYFIERMM